jgi:single-strand DNA-binding protein
MASGIATCVVAGNITRDGELNESGKVVKFSVAVNRREKEQGGEEYGEVVHYFDVKVIGNRASGLAPYLTKGLKVTVQGELQNERWETDGQKRSAVLVLAREVVLGDSRKSDDAEPAKPTAEDTGW